MNEINKCQVQSKELFNSCRESNSIIVNESLVSYSPEHVYNGIDDLAGTTMNLANCHSSTMKLSKKDKFAQSEPVYFYRI